MKPLKPLKQYKTLKQHFQTRKTEPRSHWVKKTKKNRKKIIQLYFLASKAVLFEECWETQLPVYILKNKIHRADSQQTILDQTTVNQKKPNILFYQKTSKHRWKLKTFIPYFQRRIIRRFNWYNISRNNLSQRNRRTLKKWGKTSKKLKRTGLTILKLKYRGQLKCSKNCLLAWNSFRAWCQLIPVILFN